MLWSELTWKEFPKKMELAKSTCVIPMGVLEKHGPHLPLATDVICAEELAKKAAETEPAIVFPAMVFGQNNEVRHYKGTIAISTSLMLSLLEEVCDNIGRSGFEKIVLFNIHGGNNNLIGLFLQSLLEKRKSYTVYKADPFSNIFSNGKIKELNLEDMHAHAGSLETALIMSLKPELVKMDSFDGDSYENLRRLAHLEQISTPISWYACYPEQFSGSPFSATREAGDIAVAEMVSYFAKQLKMIKDDKAVPALYNEFFDKSKNPT